MSESLYKIAENHRQALADLSDMLEAGDIDQQTLENTMSGIGGEFKQKAISVAAFIKNQESQAAEIKAAMVGMKKRMESKANKAAAMRDYLLLNMQNLSIGAIESTQFDLKIKKTPSKVIVDDEENIPGDFIIEKVIRVADKRLLSQAIKDGQKITGVRLESGYRLDIK